MIGRDVIEETIEKIALIKPRLEAAQNKLRKYTDKNTRAHQYNEGGHVLIRISSRKGLQRSKKLGKLAPLFAGPFQIVRLIGPVAYELAQPPLFYGMHNVFHVYTLKDYGHHPKYIIRYDEITFKDDLTQKDKPI